MAFAPMRGAVSGSVGLGDAAGSGGSPQDALSEGGGGEHNGAAHNGAAPP
jgi:hypothetical protein